MIPPQANKPRDGSALTAASGSVRTTSGVIVGVSSTGVSAPYASGRGRIAKATELRYDLQYLVNGTKIVKQGLTPSQPRPTYKVYSARVGDPCTIHWLGNVMAFQVVEAVYGATCQ